LPQSVKPPEVPDPGPHRPRDGEPDTAHRLHGGNDRRKIHLGIDEETPEIRAAEVTGSNVGDAPILPELAAQISADQDIASPPPRPSPGPARP